MSPRTRISHYEILEPIGRDGPAEIYRARDLRLERDVAVKLLRPEELARPGALERFRREARIASLVTHPHICTVHDSGEEGTQVFLVCELLEGRALDETVAGGALPPDRVIDLGIQLADALGAAHRRGIVHGNLTPSNVFITTDGHAKVLEFGAAGALTSTAAPARDPATAPSIVIPPVTPGAAGELVHAHLSPEQIAGAPPDARTDLFALGALLYAMTTGRAAFGGATPAEVAAGIANGIPPKVRAVQAGVPADLEAIVDRLLEKDPARRYQDAGALLADLKQARRTLDIAARAAGSRSRLQGAARVAAFAGAAVLLVALAAVARAWWPSTPAVVERNAVLVGDIANGTADPDFDGTLREAVGVYLAQSPYLDLVSDERIRETLTRMGRDPETRMTHAIAAEVCQRLGLQAMLEGSVSAVGAATMVALVATDCTSGDAIARQHVEVNRKEDVLGALGDITSAIRASLGESAPSLARNNVPIEEATTPSLEALKAYTDAVAQRTAGAELNAIARLERAIEIDPQFALAYTTLSSIYGGFGETGRSETNARLAYEHRARVSERERLFITYQYHDRVTGDQLQARDALEVWKRTYPRDYRAPNALAVLLNRFGDFTGAAAEAAEAERRNPAHPFPRSNHAQARRGAGQFADARAVAQQAIAEGLETVPMRRLLYQVAEIEGNQALAREQVEWGAGQRRGFDITGARAQVEASRGRVAASRMLYEETIAGAIARDLPQVASGYAAQAALGEILYGYRGEAVEQALTVLRTATAHEPRIRAATALALAGRADEADAFVRRVRGLRPEDTLLQNAYLPVAEAAILLARNRPDAAIEALRRASPYEHGTVAALGPVYLRGEALLRLGRNAEAIQQFDAVLGHRGSDPFSPLVALAHLGAARAHARNGAVAESRRAYEALLAQWAGADPDLPALRQARDELARLPVS